MASRRRRRRWPPRCRKCGLLRLPEENFHRNLCPGCLEKERRQRRSATGARVIANAKDGGTVKRDGPSLAAASEAKGWPQDPLTHAFIRGQRSGRLHPASVLC